MTSWISRLKSFFGAAVEDNTRGNTLRGNFILKHDTPIENDFFLDRSETPIGKGSFGVVLTGTNLRSNREFAVKIVRKEGNLKRIEREIKLLTDIDHVNIIRLFSVYDSEDTVSFVFALCRGGHLAQYVLRAPNKYLPEARVRIILRQLVSAVAHLHSLGICHRDIKLQNILLEGGEDDYPQIKLIDFGFALRYEGLLPLSTRCGTTYCTAPEVFREEYDERCDIWSAGVVCYSLMCGHRPFSAVEIPGAPANAKATVVTNILMCRYHFHYHGFSSVSDHGISFIETLLHPDYQERVSARQALELPWLQDAACDPPAAATVLAAKNTPLSEAISTLCGKGHSSQMRNTGMVAVAFNNPRVECQQLTALFQGFDTESKGYLSLKAFRKAIKSVSPSLSNKDIDTLFTAIDVDGDKHVSFTEFFAATIDPRQVDTDELNKAFQLLDSGNKGYLTVDDFYRVLSVNPNKYNMLNLSRVGRQRSDTEDTTASVSAPILSRSPGGVDNSDLLRRILSMVSAADQNKDGVISYSEFLIAVMGAEEKDGDTLTSSASSMRSIAPLDLADCAISKNSDVFCGKLSNSAQHKIGSSSKSPMMRTYDKTASKLRRLRKSISNFELTNGKLSTIHCEDTPGTPIRRLSLSRSHPDRLSDLSVGSDALNMSPKRASQGNAGADNGDDTFLHLDITSPTLRTTDDFGVPLCASPVISRRTKLTPLR